MIESDNSDLNVIDRVLEGDNEAFAALIERYQDSIFRYVYFKVNDYDEALDLTQDIFVIAFEALKTFRREAKFSTWLYSIAINHCRNFHRSKSRYKVQSLQLSNDDDEEYELQISDERQNPENDIINQDTLEILKKELYNLPQDYCEVLVMRDIEGLSYNEISDALGIGLSNVKVRIHRGREILKKRLQDRGLV